MITCPIEKIRVQPKNAVKGLTNISDLKKKK